MVKSSGTRRNGERGIEKKIEVCVAPYAVCCVVLQVSRIVSPTWGYRR